MPQEEKGFYQFERFRLDPSRQLLLREREPIPLPPKALATLAALLERQGEVVTKDELLQVVWPDTFVSEATLTQNIFRLRKALGEGANEHHFIVTIPGRGYSFVAAAAWKANEEAMAGEPARAEVPAAPQEPVALPPPETAAEPLPSSPRSSRRALLAAGLALLLLAAGAFLLSRFAAKATREPAAKGSSSLRRSVAVWGFHNLSGHEGTAWLSTALAEMFSVELAAGEKLHVLPGETVARARLDLGLEDAEDLSPEGLAQVRNLLGCDAVLLGSYLDLQQKTGRTVRIDLRLVDTATGETLVTSRSGPEPRLFELIEGLGADLRRKLGARGLADSPTTRASFPSGRQAGRLYSEGLSSLRRLDNLKARDFLQRAVQEEPGFPLAHAALARAWLNLGYDANAEREAAEAFERSAALPREERLQVEALRAETAKDWARAIDLYSTLWTFFPDDLEHGLRLARVQTEAGQISKALETVAALQRLPAPAASDPRLVLAEAEATLGDYSRQEVLAGQAAARGEELGARLLVARARFLQARALRYLGRTREAMTRNEEAARLFTEVGDRAGLATTTFEHANLLMDRNNVQGARQQYERALGIQREIGNVKDSLASLRHLGGVETGMGRFTSARQLLQEAREISREIQDPIGQAGALLNLGDVSRYEGHLEAAGESVQEALSLYRSAGFPFGEAMARTNLAHILQEQGDLEAAREMADKALHLYRATGHKRGIGFGLGRQGSVLMDMGLLREAGDAFGEMHDLGRQLNHKYMLGEAESGLASLDRLQGDLTGARRRETEALAHRRQAGETVAINTGRVSLARLLVDLGEPASAERSAQALVEELGRLQLRDLQGLAYEALIRALLAQGRIGPAEQTAREARQLVEGGQNRRVRLLVQIAAGRVAAASGRVAEARRTLERARDEAASRGLWIHRLEAALALGELELRRGDAAAGRRTLESLQREAAAKGFRLIANKAGTLLRQPVTSPA